jgi:hypothetical protein
MEGDDGGVKRSYGNEMRRCCVCDASTSVTENCKALGYYNLLLLAESRGRMLQSSGVAHAAAGLKLLKSCAR